MSNQTTILDELCTNFLCPHAGRRLARRRDRLMGDVMRPIGLTDAQLMQLQQAAKTLLPSARDEFLRGIARRLGDTPSDAALQLAISEQLAVNRIPTFLCDHAPAKETSNATR